MDAATLAAVSTLGKYDDLSKIKLLRKLEETRKAALKADAAHSGEEAGETKIRKLKVSRFRGARFELPLQFSKKTKSVAIFGENASGKSTITDALEWFIYDRIDHLWREDYKQDTA